jgi:phospholipid/cholesterol/gamma-HCH transport system substrate-binding protein
LNDTRILEIKVGITVLVGVTMLVLAIVWLKGITFKPNTFEISILFTNTAGLQIGDPVTVSGLRVGKVTDIALSRDSVLVSVSLSNSVRLKRDVSAVISSTDFFGGKKVEIWPGKDTLDFNTRGRLYGSREPDLTELTSQMREIAFDVKGTLERVDSVLTGLNYLVSDRSMTNSFRQAIYNLDSTTTRVKNIVNKSDARIDSLLLRLGQTTRSLRSLVEKTDARLDTAFTDALLVTRTLAGITTSLDSVLRQVQSGEGTLGKLVYEDDLYRRLDRASAQLDSLVMAVREKGLKLNVKLFGD